MGKSLSSSSSSNVSPEKLSTSARVKQRLASQKNTAKALVVALTTMGAISAPHTSAAQQEVAKVVVKVPTSSTVKSETNQTDSVAVMLPSGKRLNMTKDQSEGYEGLYEMYKNGDYGKYGTPEAQEAFEKEVLDAFEVSKEAAKVDPEKQKKHQAEMAEKQRLLEEEKKKNEAKRQVEEQKDKEGEQIDQRIEQKDKAHKEEIEQLKQQLAEKISKILGRVVSPDEATEIAKDATKWAKEYEKDVKFFASVGDWKKHIQELDSIQKKRATCKPVLPETEKKKLVIEQTVIALKDEFQNRK